jgi:phosphoglucosamine mutase
MLSALQVLRIMKLQDASLAALAADFDEFPSRLVNLKVSAKPPLESLSALSTLMREADAAFGTQGRHLIRYSGTESKIRILVEHHDAAQCDVWADRFVTAVRNEIG